MYCALIGDLIESRKTPTEERAGQQETLKRTLERINREYEKYIVSPFLVTLGDEFQGLLTAAEPALAILDDISAALAPRKARFGLGLGELTTSANPRQALGDDGPAYYLARAGVEELKKKKLRYYPVAIRTDGADEALLDGLCLLLDRLVGDWSPLQEQYARSMEKLGEQLLVAARYNVQASSISRALKRAHYDEYLAGKERLVHYLRTAYDTAENNGAAAAYNSALLQSKHGQLEQAEKTLSTLLEELGETNDSNFAYRVLGALADCYYRRGDNESWQRVLERQLGILDRTQNFGKKRAVILADLAACYTRQGKSEKEPKKKKLLRRAEQTYLQALGMLGGMEHTLRDVCTLQNGLASVYGALKEFDRQRELLLKTIAQLEEGGETASAGLATCYSNLAIAFQWQEDWEKVLFYARKSVEAYEGANAPDLPGIGNAYGVLGTGYRQLKRPEEAIRAYEKAVSYLQKDKRYDSLSSACDILAQLYQELGDQPRARRYEEAALDARLKWARRKNRKEGEA